MFCIIAVKCTQNLFSINHHQVERYYNPYSIGYQKQANVLGPSVVLYEVTASTEVKVLYHIDDCLPEGHCADSKGT